VPRSVAEHKIAKWLLPDFITDKNKRRPGA
jgi:hypothetical protein